jgi:hypothetical protein
MLLFSKRFFLCFTSKSDWAETVVNFFILCMQKWIWKQIMAHLSVLNNYFCHGYFSRPIRSFDAKVVSWVSFWFFVSLLKYFECWPRKKLSRNLRFQFIWSLDSIFDIIFVPLVSHIKEMRESFVLKFVDRESRKIKQGAIKEWWKP